MFILYPERHQDVVGAFKGYARYLEDEQQRFPRSAYELATSDWYYNFRDHRCPHDAWLETLSIDEPAEGETKERRSVTITATLLGAYHDLRLEVLYPKVHAYRLDMPESLRGHGDWRYHEFRLSESGRLLHEIQWCGSERTGS